DLHDVRAGLRRDHRLDLLLVVLLRDQLQGDVVVGELLLRQVDAGLVGELVLLAAPDGHDEVLVVLIGFGHPASGAAAAGGESGAGGAHTGQDMPSRECGGESGAHRRAFRQVTTPDRRVLTGRSERWAPVPTRRDTPYVNHCHKRCREGDITERSRSDAVAHRPNTPTRPPRSALDMTCLTVGQAITVLSRR